MVVEARDADAGAFGRVRYRIDDDASEALMGGDAGEAQPLPFRVDSASGAVLLRADRLASLRFSSARGASNEFLFKVHFQNILQRVHKYFLPLKSKMAFSYF